MGISVRNQKKILRLELKKRLAALTPKSRKARSLKIFRKVLKNPFYKKAGSILVYVSFGNEVETGPLIRHALKDGKRIFAAKVRVSDKKIHIYRIQDFKKDLRRGAFGIMEPKCRQQGKASELDLVLVPGLGFDRKGRRLGRGEGYFDRFLARASRAKKIGLAFRVQLVPRIPALKHDIPVDKIITD